jgi:creatinine amidohydrolase/Fe(II)-dependent formamide hydrolase-like protein
VKLAYAMKRELDDAKKRRVPLVIPLGTIEYHGPHCALGCDTLVAEGLLERLAQDMEIVLAPPIWYGVASYAVAGPEKNTVQIDVDVFEQYVYHILKSLLYGGWRKIVLLIHHQYEEENLLPMTLACMKAAKKLIFEYLETTRGIAWWGDNQNAGYYSELDAGDNPWKWISVLPSMSAAVQKATGYDHAGKWECSILAAICPEAVNKGRIPESDEWFLQDARESSEAIGREMIEQAVAVLKQRIV